jgi:hypothetical protein
MAFRTSFRILRHYLGILVLLVGSGIACDQRPTVSRHDTLKAQTGFAEPDTTGHGESVNSAKRARQFRENPVRWNVSSSITASMITGDWSGQLDTNHPLRSAFVNLYIYPDSVFKRSRFRVGYSNEEDNIVFWGSIDSLSVSNTAVRISGPVTDRIDITWEGVAHTKISNFQMEFDARLARYPRTRTMTLTGTMRATGSDRAIASLFWREGHFTVSAIGH